ncbi:hypothetical protein [Streptomyces sp. NPDC055055]
MSERLTFTLEGRDHLSRVLGHAGDSAMRLRAQMEDASDGSGRAILTLTQDAEGRLHDLEGRFLSAADAAALLGHRAGEAARPIADWSRVADEARQVGKELRTAWLSLTPALVPMAATLAPLTSGLAAGAVGMGVFALAAGRQVVALSKASQAETKYKDAVEDSGRSSAEAIKAQTEFAKTLAKLPEGTRRAAAAFSVFKDSYTQWADSLSKDTTGPLIKGMGLVQGIFPKLTPTVRGAAAQLDRLFTIAGGRVNSPGFDAFMKKVDSWSTGALTRMNDSLVNLLRTGDRQGFNSGLSQFMEFARAQGPAVSATLQDLGRALLNILKASADVGVGMLALVQTLSHLIAAVPPGALTALFQLAVAIKATAIAMAMLGTARAFVTTFIAQLGMMSAASTGAGGRLAALTASFGAMSRGAKAALVGSGIGLLVIALSELSANSAKAPPDVDKLTVSLKQLGSTGKVTGEAAKAFGSDLSGLYDKVKAATDPSTTDQIQQWIVTLGGLASWDSTPVKEGKENLDAIDQSLASLVQGGRPELAAAALQMLTARYAEGGRSTEEFTGAMDGYQAALDNTRFEQDLVAQSMGLFGAQAMQTKEKLDAQKMAADGLRQSLHALNQTTLEARGGVRGMEAAIDAATESLKKNGATVDEGSAKGRANAQALDDLAAATMKATEAKYEETGSWSQSMAVHDRGRSKLIALATQMYGNEAAAKRLADQILRTPDKTARLKGNLEDLQAKLTTAKAQLGKVPDSRKAAIRAEISQLQAQIAKAKGAIASVQGKTVSIMVEYRKKNSGASDFTKMIGGYAGGGNPKPGETFWVGEDGPELMTLGSGGGARVWDHQTSMGMVRQAGAGKDAGAGLAEGMLGARARVEQAARMMASGVEAGVRAELEIASPSKKMKALMADVGRGVVIGLTGTKSQIRATAMDLVKDIWTAWEGTKSTKDTALVKMVNRETAKLQALASRRDALKTRLASAQALLKARVEERAKYRSDVRGQVQESASLSNLGLDPEQVTAGSISAGLSQKLAKVKQFRRWIDLLAKKGLSKTLLRQLLAMGPEAGYAYASALAGMSSAGLKSVNATQGSIDKEADALGKTGASVLYDAGVNSAQGLVKGLASQEKAVEQQMLRIAKLMEKAIKKALGIRSPSRVGFGIGENYGDSIGGGARAALPRVGRAVDAIAGRMANMRPVPGLPAAGRAATGGAGHVTNHYITVQGAIDPVSTAKQIQKVLLKDKRAAGGTARGFE